MWYVTASLQEPLQANTEGAMTPPYPDTHQNAGHLLLQVNRDGAVTASYPYTSPRGLTFSWWGRYGLCPRYKPVELALSFFVLFLCLFLSL